ncbi:MAG TPA: hypothetical protein VGL56_12830 [Fimbriimonadaceae bacterium]|jgi:hypothetical protein
MNSRKRTLFCITASALVLPILGSIAGCGSGPSEDPAKTQSRVDAVTQEQAIIDRSSGTYDSLSTADKAALVKLLGSEKQAQTAFKYMKPHTPNAAAQSGLPPSQGGGG